MNKRVCLVSALAVSLSSFALADWPGYRGTDNQGVAQMATALETLTSADLKELWRVPLGASFGQFAVVGDNALVFVERGEDEFVACLDAKTGKELWATRLDKSIKEGNGNGPRSTPTIDGGRVYVYGTNRKLACLDLAKGNILWQHDIVAEFAGSAKTGLGPWGSAASPTIVDDKVIVVGGGKGHGIVAFDKNTGTLAWAATDETLTHATATVATIAGTKQVICFMTSGLVSVDPATGKVLWRFAHKFSTSTAASPVVGGKNGDIVYCSAGYKVGAAACRVTKDGETWTATKLWATPGQSQNHWSTPVYFDGYVYGLFGHNDPKGPLACVDIETGEVKWNQVGFGTQGGITRLGDKLLIQTPKGELVLVAADPAAYKELGRVPEFKGKNWTAPAVSDGKIYARSVTEGACFELVGK